MVRTVFSKNDKLQFYARSLIFVYGRELPNALMTVQTTIEYFFGVLLKTCVYQNFYTLIQTVA